MLATIAAVTAAALFQFAPVPAPTKTLPAPVIAIDGFTPDHTLQPAPVLYTLDVDHAVALIHLTAPITGICAAVLNVTPIDSTEGHPLTLRLVLVTRGRDVFIAAPLPSVADLAGLGVESGSGYTIAVLCARPHDPQRRIYTSRFFHAREPVLI